jgi:hypothetical protein
MWNGMLSGRREAAAAIFSDFLKLASAIFNYKDHTDERQFPVLYGVTAKNH